MQHKHQERKFKNVFLTGMPGAGKSLLGKTFAYLSRRVFLDFDRLVSEVAQKSIPDIFATEGEEGFRAYEAKCLKRVARLHNHVIAMGGGTLCNQQNLNFVRQHGLVVTVEADIGIIAARLLRERESKPRPLVMNIADEAQLKERLTSLLENRRTFYDESDVFVSSSFSSVDALALELLTLEQKLFQREYQRVVAAVGEAPPPHLFSQGHYFLMKRRFNSERAEGAEPEFGAETSAPAISPVSAAPNDEPGAQEQVQSEPSTPITIENAEVAEPAATKKPLIAPVATPKPQPHNGPRPQSRDGAEHGRHRHHDKRRDHRASQQKQGGEHRGDQGGQQQNQRQRNEGRRHDRGRNPQRDQNGEQKKRTEPARIEPVNAPKNPDAPRIIPVAKKPE